MSQVQVAWPQPHTQVWPGVHFAQQLAFFWQRLLQHPTSANANVAAPTIMIMFFMLSFLSPPRAFFPGRMRKVCHIPAARVSWQCKIAHHSARGFPWKKKAGFGASDTRDVAEKSATLPSFTANRTSTPPGAGRRKE